MEYKSEAERMKIAKLVNVFDLPKKSAQDKFVVFPEVVALK